jgi:hypothetical protein
MRIAGIPFYQANANNYAKGRGRPIRKLTVHHSAGWENTLRYLWADPNRNASSTFWVGNISGQIEQYVDTDDTPFTNGNYASNQESLTVEVRGDWRGFYDRGTLDNLYTLMVKLLPHYPNLILEFHMDVSSSVTLCPADLKHKGYAKDEFLRAVASFNTPNPTPTPSVIKYEAITPKRIKLTRAANLWDFNFTSWQNAKAVKAYNAGEVIDVVAIATNGLGGKYYMTAYSYNGGAIRSTNGFNVADCEDYVPQITQPPTVEQKWEPMANPREMRLVYDNKVVDLDKNEQVGSTIVAGTDISLVELKTVSAGKVYARSKWARDNNKNWGIPLDQFTEKPSTTPEPPREPVPEPPIDVDPTTPGNGDVEKRLNAIEAFLKLITDFFVAIFKNFPLFKKGE